VRGQAVLFPNLFPLCASHAVVMVGDRHFRALDDFPQSLLEDALGVSLDFLRRLHEVEPEQAYCTINANYLFPAGASVVHPHLQVLASSEPGTQHRLLLDRSAAWLEERGETFWSELVATERGGERWIGELGSGAWLAAFAPLGPHEVQAVWPSRRNLLEWDDDEMNALARGLSAVLAGYHDLGLSTFNLSLFSGPLGGESPGFRCMLRVVNRQNVHPHHRTDDYYFQKLLQNEIVLRRPERLAETLRERFGGVAEEGGA
jgi:galactose-1-phosphate uridylyltransferase